MAMMKGSSLLVYPITPYHMGAVMFHPKVQPSTMEVQRGPKVGSKNSYQKSRSPNFPGKIKIKRFHMDKLQDGKHFPWRHWFYSSTVMQVMIPLPNLKLVTVGFTGCSIHLPEHYHLLVCKLHPYRTVTILHR